MAASELPLSSKIPGSGGWDSGRFCRAGLGFRVWGLGFRGVGPCRVVAFVVRLLILMAKKVRYKEIRGCLQDHGA